MEIEKCLAPRVRGLRLFVSSAIELAWCAEGKIDGCINIKKSQRISSSAGILLIELWNKNEVLIKNDKNVIKKENAQDSKSKKGQKTNEKGKEKDKVKDKSKEKVKEKGKSKGKEKEKEKEREVSSVKSKVAKDEKKPKIVQI